MTISEMLPVFWFDCSSTLVSSCILVALLYFVRSRVEKALDSPTGKCGERYGKEDGGGRLFIALLLAPIVFWWLELYLIMREA
jgi:hypothetical protein